MRNVVKEVYTKAKSLCVALLIYIKSIVSTCEILALHLNVRVGQEVWKSEKWELIKIPVYLLRLVKVLF